MYSLRELIDIYLYKRHRLANVPMLPLGSDLDRAVEVYGHPYESKPCEEAPQIQAHRFAVGEYHEVVALEHEESIQSITYWSMKSVPGRDLDHVLEAYQGDSSWKEWEIGHRYMRADQEVHLWCSAIPAIGVAYLQFTSDKSKMETAYRIEQLENLEDVTWAKTDVVNELQKQFVEEGNTKLQDFARRSDNIAVSADGRRVLIVRRHQAVSTSEGVRDFNAPPELPDGLSRLALNWFEWSERGGSWTKSGLPTDALITEFRSEDNVVTVTLHKQDSEERTLTFTGSLEELRNLFIPACGGGATRDEAVWEKLEAAADVA